MGAKKVARVDMVAMDVGVVMVAMNVGVLSWWP